MTRPVTTHRNWGLRIHKITLVHQSGEFDEYTFTPGMLNIITGVRNSSKTTTLNAIDYCLGDRGGVIDALGAAVAEKYVEIRLSLSVNGGTHTLTRSLQHGRMNKVSIDGNERTVDTFSDWILDQLGWPNLRVPKGLIAAAATEVIPLSFRNILRHIYRKEDSWTGFANKEVEFIRRAVVSQLLGFARARYSNKDFEIAQARRRLAEAQATEREVLESTQQAVTAISERLHLPPVHSMQLVNAARRDLRAQLDTIYEQRRELTEEINALVHGGAAPAACAGYDSSLTATYEQVSHQLQRAAGEVVSLEQLHEEHVHSAKTVTAEIGRMERLITSVELFDSLPVRLCPACEQRVDPRREHAEDACYLCALPVDEDQRRRRAQVEIRSLKSELADLEEAIAHTVLELQASQRRRDAIQGHQAQLAERLNEERAAQLSPFMAALERFAAQIAQLEQKMTAFPAIEEILQRRVEVSQMVTAAQQALDAIDNESSDPSSVSLSASERCAIFADRMNIFLQRYRSNGWVKATVTISASDLTFYVGTRPWNQALGAEAKVLFFLAYSYASLFLASDLDEECTYSGLLLLDNPYQHGIDPQVVGAVLQDLGAAAVATGAQVISTQALPAPQASEIIREIKMPAVYEAP
jgi:hypothetical protein